MSSVSVAETRKTVSAHDISSSFRSLQEHADSLLTGRFSIQETKIRLDLYLSWVGWVGVTQFLSNKAISYLFLDLDS